MLSYSVAAQVNTAIRDDLQRYYDGWVVCGSLVPTADFRCHVARRLTLGAGFCHAQMSATSHPAATARDSCPCTAVGASWLAAAASCIPRYVKLARD